MTHRSTTLLPWGVAGALVMALLGSAAPRAAAQRAGGTVTVQATVLPAFAAAVSAAAVSATAAAEPGSCPRLGSAVAVRASAPVLVSVRLQAGFAPADSVRAGSTSGPASSFRAAAELLDRSGHAGGPPAVRPREIVTVSVAVN